MTLRLRLVLALVVLVAAGLALFGVITYVLYANSEYQRLDTQLRAAEPALDQQIDSLNGISSPGSHGGPVGGPSSPFREGGPGGPPVFVAPGTFAELITSSGQVYRGQYTTTSSAEPHLPSPLPKATPAGRTLTVGSTSGSGHWRVLLMVGRDGSTTVVAIPTTEVTKALHQLVLIETIGAAALLLALSAGSWLVLRRGLHPLEQMAGRARSITAGDLSQRVSPAGGRTEVGELGLALNTMLENIETAFAEREATELRLRQFLADASHELRTPLTSIQGFAELFRVGGQSATVELPIILRRIEEESARMAVLVDDLLLLARLDQPRAAERNPVDLTVLAADACSDAVATAPDRQVTLDAPEPVIIAGDQDHLRQAIANLVTNAVRHTPDGTPIEVSARLEDGQAVVTVRDHGEGLDDQALAHAFDRFWQADRARVGAGAGLGLAIVASIAHEHGGDVYTENAPGGGALFRIRLPLNAPAGKGAADTNRPGPHAGAPATSSQLSGGTEPPLRRV